MIITFSIFFITLNCLNLVIANISWNILTLQERHLKVIRRVPNIIKLQRLLISCYQDKLDRSDSFSIKEAITAGKFTIFTYLYFLMKHEFICIYASIFNLLETLLRSFLFLIIEPNSDLMEMVNNFLEAWECVREDIAAFSKFFFFTSKLICNKHSLWCIWSVFRLRWIY